MQKIQFYFHDRRPTLRERKRLKLYLEGIFADEKKKLVNLSYIFCSDKHLLSVNREFLKHDYYTDVITFNLSSIPKEIEGDIYISVDRIKENAKKLAVSFNEEFYRVIFHGALHLCGYKDKKSNEILKMRAMEEKHLRRYFI